MRTQIPPADSPQTDPEALWARVMAAAAAAAGGSEQAAPARSGLAPQDQALLDLYLPLCGVAGARAFTLAHVGQSLDGFIATTSGDSYYINGPDNILHLHRLRALCDAVIVGAGTVAADNPRLTTRLVPGPNPLRVIIDPSRRLDGSQHVFTDGAAPTLRVCCDAAATPSTVPELRVARTADGIDLEDLLTQLWARGCRRVFVEGGGITVSAFLQAGLLDRLHIAVAPLLIGEGRRALRLPASDRLAQCLRPSTRVFAMGSDMLYDCDLRAVPAGRANTSS